MPKLINSVAILILASIFLLVSCSKVEKQAEKAPQKEEIKENKNNSTTKKNLEKKEVVDTMIGKIAANIDLVDLDGNKTTLETYKGKVIMLNFWATWCGPCRAEIPDFIKMYEKHEKDGLVIVGISGFREDIESIKKYVSENSMNYPILFVEKDAVETLVKNYGGIQGIPTTFLIDKKGVIRFKWVGPKSEEKFMEEVNKHL